MLCNARRMRLPAALIVLTTSLFAATARAEQSAPVPIESEYLSNLRQVTTGFSKAGEGYFAPDGRSIVYQAISAGYPFYQIYTQRLAPHALPQRISTGRGRTTCSYFSPDGRRIIFASSHLDPQLGATERAALAQQEDDLRTGRRRRYSWVFDPRMDIFEADTDGTILRRLTSQPGYDAECAFSPDGRQIVFSSDRDGDPDLYVVDADGANVRQLTDEPGYDGGPFFSPDGQWVVYRSDRKRKEYLQIHAIRADGTGDVALTDNVGVNWAPYWHPTEPYIIWTGADHRDPTVRPNYDLWLLRYEIDETGLRGVGKPRRVTDHPEADVLPVFSPDGRRLMWTSNRGEDRTSQLWIAEFRLPDTD